MRREKLAANEVGALRMLEAGIRHMPVTDDGNPTGMVSLRDLVALVVWPGVAPESH